MMAAIIMAGRTGAAFAAQIGTMQVNEEIDALQTLGISPMEFLVLPRMLALILMMPLLCIYADLMGILGGFIVGVGMLDLGVFEYVEQTRRSVSLTQINIGIIKAVVFGVLVAVAGCLRGMQCGNSSQAVGMAATSAVVTAIVGMTISTAVITVICNLLGIAQYFFTSKVSNQQVLTQCHKVNDKVCSSSNSMIKFFKLVKFSSRKLT